MTITTKYDPGQLVNYKSKLGSFKLGTIEKVFTNVHTDKKVHVGYFLKGVYREFKESELTIPYERQNSR